MKAVQHNKKLRETCSTITCKRAGIFRKEERLLCPKHGAEVTIYFKKKNVFNEIMEVLK